MGEEYSPMRRFLASGWFSFLICVIMAGVTAAAFAILKPTGDAVGNSEIVKYMKIAGWAVGPFVALLSLILIGILNLLRRLFRARRVSVLHPVIVLIGIVPWVIFAWQITGEPPFTPIARGAVEFIGRPLLWGSLVATLLTIFFSIPLFIPSKKK